MSAAEKQETTEATPKRSLVRKLAEVKGAVDRIAKNGHNDHFNYDFATESDIAAAVRKEMAERHLVMFPSVLKTDWEKVARKNGGETKLCTLTVEFTVEDGDSGETRKFTIMGQGEDALDKATYKAMTGAEKYALLKLFMIPTGDDPEKDTDNRVNMRTNQPAPSQPADRTQSAAPGTVPHECGSKATTPGFGRSKGTCLCKLEAPDLEFYLKAATAGVNDPAKARFKKANEAWLAVVQQFVTAKAFPESAGKKTAPVAASPRQASLPVDSEPEEVVTPLQAMWRLGREFNMEPKDIVLRAQGIVSKVVGFTHADVAKVREILEGPTGPKR